MNSRILKRLYLIAKPYKRDILLVVIISFVINILEIINPYLIRVVIDEYLSNNVYQIGKITITMIGIAYIANVAIKCLLDLFSRCKTNLVGENIVFDLRQKLFEFIQHANVKFHDNTSSGKIFVRITNDAEDISNLFKDVITTFIKDVVLIIALIAIMLVFNVKLCLLTFTIVPVIVIFSCYISSKLNKLYNYSKSIRTRLNTFLAEAIYGIKLIKVFNRQKEKLRECEKMSIEYFNSRKKTGIFEGLLPAGIYIIQNIGISIVVVACSSKFWGISLNVGEVYVFLTYVQMLFDPITRIIENIEVVQDAFVSMNKINEILSQEECVENFEQGRNVEKIDGKIEFKNVWFSYDKENYVLKDVSFVINPKESVALVGKTGSGKTTITNLINRFYEIDKGEILIDGINIKDISLSSLRSKIGTILQDPFIFAGSISNNIRLNDKNITDDRIDYALNKAHLAEIVENLPNKKEYVARERGSEFSVGQKQLIAFARIFAHNPSVFIFDEATANIDTHTEKMIQSSVDRISSDITSIFIAHRLSTIVNVDKIFVLDNGKIIEEGNHSELLKKGGYYSDLYNSYYDSLRA